MPAINLVFQTKTSVKGCVHLPMRSLAGKAFLTRLKDEDTAVLRAGSVAGPPSGQLV